MYIFILFYTQGDSDGSDDTQFPPATICLNKSLGVTQELVDCFQTAVDCWQFLNNHELFEKGKGREKMERGEYVQVTIMQKFHFENAC